jgi:hypothetical protein
MAKVAMLAEMPDSRMSGKPTITPIAAAANPPARAPPIGGHSTAASQSGRSGRNTPLAADGMVSSAET